MRDRKVRYAQSMAEKPTAAQVREAEERMRQHLIAECDRAGYPVRGFLDTTVRQVGRHSLSVGCADSSPRGGAKGRRGVALSVGCADSSPRGGAKGRWIITVTALIGHVV